MRFRLLLCLLASGLSGCAGGIIAAVAAIAGTSSGGGGNGDALPTVAFVGAPGFLVDAGGNPSPDRISMRFQVSNDDNGRLSARVEVVPVDATGAATGPPATAVPLAASDSLEDIPGGTDVTFLWDVKANFGEDSVRVAFFVTPIENARAGVGELSVPFRAGNTPFAIRNIAMTSNRAVLRVSFDMIDEEFDRVPVSDDFMQVEIALAAGEFQRLPLDLVERQDFPGAPFPGNQGSFSFDVSRLAGRPDVSAELQSLGEPGFFGEVRVRVALRDFAEEEFSRDENSFVFDNNDEPIVEVLPISLVSLENGVVSIRYRVFDEERNPVDLVVLVDLFDGAGLRPAMELPVLPSEGSSGVCAGTDPGSGCILDPDDFGRFGTPFHRFFWDAIVQPPPGDEVFFVFQARDREPGAPVTQTLSGIRLEPLVRRDIKAGEQPEALLSADFDADGFLDLIVQQFAFGGGVTYFRGGRDGLSPARQVEFIPDEEALLAASGDFDADGFPDLVLGFAGAGESTVTYFRGGSGGLDAASGVDLSIPVDLDAAAVGDFDGDGFADLAVAGSNVEPEKLVEPKKLVNGFEPASVAVLAGGADGLSEGRLSIVPLPFELIGSAIAADFNADGFSDLVVFEIIGRVVFFAGGEDGLSDKRAAELDVSLASTVTSADFDADGFVDLAVYSFASSDGGSASIEVFRGGTGGLSDARRSRLELPDDVRDIVSGDFDADGFADLALGGFDVELLEPEVIFFRGGDGGLSEERRVDIPLPEQEAIFALASGDLDGDGVLDLLATARDQRGDGSVVLFSGGADGLSTERTRALPVGDEPEDVAAGDFDGDGSADIVTANADSETVSYLRNDEGLSEERAAALAVGDEPGPLVVGDFNGDRFPDVVVANSDSESFSLLSGGEDGLSPRRSLEIEVAGTTTSLVAGDFDGDGLSDLVVGQERGEGLLFIFASFFAGGADGLSEDRACDLTSAFFQGPAAASAVAAGDFDGDGVLDLVVAEPMAGRVLYFRSSFAAGCPPGGLTLEDAVDIPVGAGPVALLTGDFDGDASLDLAVASADAGSITLLQGGGDGLSDARRVELSVGVLPAALGSGDFDGDGFLDLVVANEGSDSVSVLGGGPDGLSEERTAEIPVETGPAALAGGDFNGDGFPDVVAAGRAAGRLTLLCGGPDGISPSAVAAIAVGAEPTGLGSGDFDGDGFLDVVAANAGAGTVSFLRGSASGLTGDRVREIAAGGRPVSVIAGDFDANASLDLSVANFDSSSLTYLRSRFLRPHASCLVDPAAGCSLEDPGGVPRHRLELAAGAFSRTTQVSLLPVTVFPLPQGEAFARGASLTVVAGPVAVLRETQGLSEAAMLTLRLRDRDPDLLEAARQNPERLRVIRRSTSSGAGEDLGVAVELVDFASGAAGDDAVKFPITTFGAFLVAIEQDR